MSDVNQRKADYPVDPQFLARWSPRSFRPEPISNDELMTLFEAARWAPSSYNSQPWNFIYATRESSDWEPFLELLIEFNRMWVRNASALVFVVSNRLMAVPTAPEPVPSHTHSFDAGAAWGYLALQATKMGLATHGMIGFDVDGAARLLGVPDDHRVEAAIAIGRQAEADLLPEGLRARELASDRKPVSEFAFPGRFGERAS